MQTREKRRHGGYGGVSVSALVAAALFAVSLSACGDDDGRCDRSFSTDEVMELVPNSTNIIASCNQLGETVATVTPTFQTPPPTPLVTPTPRPPAFNCKDVVYSNCNRPAGTGSDSDTRTAPSQSAEACTTSATNFVTQLSTRVAAEVAADPQAEFECGGHSFTDESDFTADFDAETMMCTLTANVTVDVTVTACLICDPPKQEPRCQLSGCLECAPFDVPQP